MNYSQKSRYVLSFLLSLSFMIYLLIILLPNVKITPFIILGLFSLLAMLLPDKYQNFAIFFIYAPAIYSLCELILNGNFELLIELTTGYILSLSFLFAYGYYKSKTPASIYTNYFAAHITTFLALDAALNSDKTAFSIFYNYIFRVIRTAVLGSEVIREISLSLAAPLAAVSVLGFVYYLGLKNSATPFKFNDNSLIVSLILSISIVGLIVFYSSLFADSVAMSLILTAASLIAISISTRVMK